MSLKRHDERLQRAAVANSLRRCLVFAVGELELGIAVGHVKQSLSASSLAGSEVTVHGEHYPVVDARALLGLAPAPAGGGIILALEATGGRVGLAVDRVVALIALEEGAVAPLPAVFGGADRERFEGLIRCASRVVPLLRMHALLAPRSSREESPRPHTALGQRSR